jgi:hypothetical protein
MWALAACAATVIIKIIKMGGGERKKGGVFSFCPHRLNLFLGVLCRFSAKKNWVFFVFNWNFD